MSIKKNPESTEMYLETILLLSKRKPEVHSIDIASEMGFSKPSVSVAMKHMREDGLITMDDSNHIHLTEDGRLRLSVAVSLPAGEADVTCFGVDGAGKLSDDRYFVFYNQTRSPEGAVSMEQSGGTTAFSIDLGRLPDFL